MQRNCYCSIADSILVTIGSIIHHYRVKCLRGVDNKGWICVLKAGVAVVGKNSIIAVRSNSVTRIRRR